MHYMNDSDIAFARSRFGHGDTPNRLVLAIVVDNLAEWTNTHSDGWAYWVKPRQAANKAMALIESTTYSANLEQETTDISQAEMLAAIRPIKAFLTRRNVSQEERDFILRITEPV